MKKSIIASLFVIVLLSACKETETTVIDITGTATIKGTVLADTEKVNTPFVSEPVAGVIVRILWDSEDLGVVSDGDNIRKSLSDTTNSNGEFSFEVPTIENGIQFTVEFDELEAEVSYNNGVAATTQTVIFQEASSTVTVRTGEVATVNQDYEDNFKTGFVLKEFATISGVVEVDSEQINTEDIPELASGAPVTVKWEDNAGNQRSLSTTTDASGQYSVQVPTEDINGNYTVVFEEFTVSVDYFDGFRNVTGFSATFNEDATNNSVSVSTGNQVTINHNYGSSPKEVLPTFGLIQGTLTARTNAIPGSEVDSPVENVTVRISWTDGDGITRGVFVTTNAQGEYSSEVPLAETDDFSVRFAEFSVTYSYNNGMSDVTGATATYAEFTTAANNVGAGEERTVDRTITTPTSVVD